MEGKQSQGQTGARHNSGHQAQLLCSLEDFWALEPHITRPFICSCCLYQRGTTVENKSGVCVCVCVGSARNLTQGLMHAWQELYY